MYGLFWSGWVRVLLFAVLFAGGYWLSGQIPLLLDRFSNFSLLWEGFSGIASDDHSALSQPEFAYALACMIVSTAFGLALAYLVMHVFVLGLALRRLRLKVVREHDASNLGGDFDRVRDILKNEPVVGHAFQEFFDTCFKMNGSPVAYHTMRPHVFINMGVAREHLFGLKMMPTLPGYFVGAGLLFTFIGLVIALGKAANGLAGDPGMMTKAVNELLNAATFKFSTSIAGLLASLVLSLAFKIYTNWMEASFDALCRAVERRLLYMPPQRLSAEMQVALDDQLSQLKEINSDKFFAQLGEAVGPKLTEAVQEAVQPVVVSMTRTAEQLNQTSHQGVEDLLTKFIHAIQGGAGREMEQIASVVAETRTVLQELNSGLAVSGSRFAEQMAQATETFARVMHQSSARSDATNAAGRETLDRTLATLADTLDAVKASISESARMTGETAAVQVDRSLHEVLDGTAKRMQVFEDGLSAIQQQIGNDAAKAVEASRNAADAAAEAATRAAAEIAESLRSSLGEAIKDIRGEVDRMTSALNASDAALDRQTIAMREVTGQSNEAAKAFEQVTAAMNSASRPLTQSGEQIAAATKTMSDSIERSVQSLSESHAAAHRLAEGLAQHVEQVRAMWTNYEQRFENVDKDLAGGIEGMIEETRKHQQILAAFAVKIDEGCAKAVADLGKVVSNLSENTDTLGETFDEFLTKMQSPEKIYART